MAGKNITFCKDWLKDNPSNILIRMPNWIGDAVMATPILADLRAHYPDAEITAMCQSNISPLLISDPHINHLFSYKRPSGWIHREHHLKIIDSLKKGKYDLGIFLTNSFSSAWWFWRGNVKNRLGFRNGLRNFLLNKALPYPKNKEIQHQVLTYKNLLKPLGISVTNTPPQLYLTPTEIGEAKETLKKLGITFGKDKIVGINPGAAYGSAKCWLPERFVQVTKKLLEDPQKQILYFGDGAGSSLVTSICQNFPERVINMAGKTTLRELMALIQICSVFLTNDSGPMHIAAALGTPVLALFGSTNATKTGPNPQGRVICKKVECSPCYKRVCPIDFRCMTRIESLEVYEELIHMINHHEQNKSP